MPGFEFNNPTDDRWVALDDVASMMEGSKPQVEAIIKGAVAALPTQEQRDEVFKGRSRAVARGGESDSQVKQSFVLSLVESGDLTQKLALGEATGRRAVNAGTADRIR